MEIYDIVDAINIATKNETGGHYVLHRSMEVQQMKIYKKLSYVLYLVGDGYKTRVLTQQCIVRLPDADIEKVWAIQDRQFLVHLLTWFKYGKLANESIPDTNN